MELKTSETKATTLTVNLIDGIFNLIDSKDILISLLDKKINYHKIKRLSITEGDIADNCVYDNGRIDELIEEKQKVLAFFEPQEGSGKTLKINSTISINN